MRILITGAEGQLGRALARRAVGHDVISCGRDDLDVRSLSCRDVIASARPELVINAAAMTNVDRCEGEPDRAHAINALGARNVALGSRAADAHLLQISTDYVFDGCKDEPYWEFDAPAPINVYGASKLAGERLVQEVYDRVFIVRAAWLYGLGGRNFVTRVLRLAGDRDELSIVNNEVGSPTFCDDFADAVLELVATGAHGTYHLAGEGECSRYEFARAILDESGHADYPLQAADHYPRAACPPAYAPLRNFAAEQLGVRLPPWRDGLARYFERGGGLSN
ncbi:MAG: dTDP-4-dehydrorhamnose reductase [Anaerolineae bacterium]|jgi:dTDP-4-dehydrorhamnose reductase